MCSPRKEFVKIAAAKGGGKKKEEHNGEM